MDTCGRSEREEVVTDAGHHAVQRRRVAVAILRGARHEEPDARLDLLHLVAGADTEAELRLRIRGRGTTDIDRYADVRDTELGVCVEPARTDLVGATDEDRDHAEADAIHARQVIDVASARGDRELVVDAELEADEAADREVRQVP